jgi:hypothetical protein
MNKLTHTVKNIGGFDVPTFPYVETEIQGVGVNKTPIVSLDQYLDHSQDDLLHIESLKGLAMCDNYKLGSIYGSIPPSEVARFNNSNTWSEFLHQLDSRDPTGVHRQAIEDIVKQYPDPSMSYIAVKNYTNFALGSVVPWFFNVYLKSNSFRGKTLNKEAWDPVAKYFPNVINYIKTLPFKGIGRVQYFTTYPGVGVIAHRDTVFQEHKDHSINLFFGGGWRPSFILDTKNNKKVYLEQGARSYYFNNRDYHGVDPEPVFKYTLRIDGTFTDEFCEKLGLEDGFTWKQSYEK